MRGARRSLRRWQKVNKGKIFSRQNAVDSIKAERSLAIEKIRDMGVAKAGDASEVRSGEKTPINAPQDFKAKTFMELFQIHAGTVTLS